MSFEPALFASSLRCITARHFIPMKNALPPKRAMSMRGVRRLRAHVYISINLHSWNIERELERCGVVT
jgi:hypothetical protein